MQIALITLALFGFNLGLVQYQGATPDQVVTLVCADDGYEGTCWNLAGEVESAYFCGPEGCAGF